MISVDDAIGSDGGSVYPVPTRYRSAHGECPLARGERSPLRSNQNGLCMFDVFYTIYIYI